MFAIPVATLSVIAAIFMQFVEATSSLTTTHVDKFVRRDAEAPPFIKRAASCTFPTPPKTSSLSTPIAVAGTFDGGNSGSTLQNVVVGANQAEDVCKGAIAMKQTSGQSNIIGGGARSASKQVVQHNGGGTVKIDSYCVQTFGKLYRSCGNFSTRVISESAQLAG